MAGTAESSFCNVYFGPKQIYPFALYCLSDGDSRPKQTKAIKSICFLSVAFGLVLDDLNVTSTVIGSSKTGAKRKQRGNRGEQKESAREAKGE